MNVTMRYVALAVAIGTFAGFGMTALIPALTAALIATNLALATAARVWGPEAFDV